MHGLHAGIETADAKRCIFCAVSAGRLPSHRLYADERVIAFLDINPATTGHTLVVPRTHVADIHDISDDDLAACSRVAKLIAKQLKDELGADGVNLLNSAGQAAWQGVFHFHIHVVPRYVGDSLKEPWRRVPASPESLDVVAASLAGHPASPECDDETSTT